MVMEWIMERSVTDSYNARFIYLLNGRSTIHFEAPFENTAFCCPLDYPKYLQKQNN